jgi:hypothetical protein
MGRKGLAVAVIALSASLGMVVDAPASAATKSPGCNWVDETSAIFANTYTATTIGAYAIYAGETITMTVTSMTSGTSLGLRVNGATVATGTLAGGAVSYTFPSDTTISQYGSQNAATWSGSFTCSAAPDPVSPGVSPPPIPAWVQAYGRFGAKATCDAGWEPSWQAWAEPITGGWVCARSIPSLG